MVQFYYAMIRFENVKAIIIIIIIFLADQIGSLTLQFSASSSSTFLAAKSRWTNDFLERYLIPEAICFANCKKRSSNSLVLCLLCESNYNQSKQGHSIITSFTNKKRDTESSLRNLDITVIEKRSHALLTLEQ